MPLFEVYSYRRRRAQGELPDVWQYDFLSRELRVQICHILRNVMGASPESYSDWLSVHDAVARERGVFSLSEHSRVREKCESYLVETEPVDYVIDFVEIAFRYIETKLPRYDLSNRRRRGITFWPPDAIEELNERFRRAGAGYQYESRQIFRIDSQLVHQQVVRPALQFLQNPGFDGPRDEFLKAYAHYRAGKLKEAIVDANNAFESTLKAVCEQLSWQYQKGARASDLLKIVRGKGLLPDYLDNSFDQLAATLKSGLPKVREQEGAHGQGAQPRDAPLHVAGYALHLAAAKILFLTQAYEAKER